MEKEKQVTMKIGKDTIALYYPEATEEQALQLITIWNNNDGVEYDDNIYTDMNEWLYISERNGYSLEDIVGE